MLLIGGWLAGHSPMLVQAAGGSVVELSAGVIGAAVALGMKVPIGLWPRAPRRARFSPVTGVGAGVAAAVVVFLGGSDLAEQFLHTGRVAVPLALGGVGAWAVAIGSVRQRPFARWYAIALGVTVGPVAAAVVAAAGVGQLAPVSIMTTLRVGMALAVLVGGTALITQELAFRRLLIGQSGEAGLALVLLGGLAYGLWRATLPLPEAGWGWVIVGGVSTGIVLGALYTLSRSLLVAAAAYGIQAGLLGGLRTTSSAVVGETGLGAVFWTVYLIANAVVAVAFAQVLYRRNGWWAGLRMARVGGDAAGH